MDIKIVPDYAGSPNAKVEWSFKGESSDLSHFRITVETEEGGIIFEDSIAKDGRSTTLKNLRPMTKHQVNIVAVYSDEIQNHTSVDFQHEGMCVHFISGLHDAHLIKAASLIPA